MLKFGKVSHIHSPPDKSIYPSVHKTRDWAKRNSLWVATGKIMIDHTLLVIGARVIFNFSHTGIATGIIQNAAGKICQVVVDAGNHNNGFAPKIYDLKKIEGFIISPLLYEDPVYRVDDSLNGVEKAGGRETTR